MCFAPQRRALFRHLNYQKWSGAEVFCTFWLRNVLRASSRHNGVQFFISHLASWLRTRRFSEPTFRPSCATNHRKNAVFRDFPTFSRIFLSSTLLFPLTLPISAFHLSALSEVWLLNFLRLSQSSHPQWFFSASLGLFETWVSPIPKPHAWFDHHCLKNWPLKGYILCLDQTPLLDWKVVDSLQHLLNSCGVLMKRSAATGVSYRNIVYYINPYVTMGHLTLLASVTLVFTPK